MKIAVPYENGNIFPHFGRTVQFKLYEVENGRVTATRMLGTHGQGHGALAGLLEQTGVDVLICGGIGGGAQAALSTVGIRLYGGVSGPADQAVQDLLAGTLAYDPAVHCDHHGQEHGQHNCHSEEKHGCAGNGGCGR